MERISLSEIDANKIVIDELHRMAEYSYDLRIITLSENEKIKYETLSTILYHGKEFTIIGKMKTPLYFRLLKRGIERHGYEVKYINHYYRGNKLIYEVVVYVLYNKRGFSKTLTL